MKNVMTAGAALLLSTSIASAGGLDRSGQPVGILFEDGNVIELSFGFISPNVSGEAVGLGLTGESGNMAGSYAQFGGGVKYQYTDEIALALIFDQPYGASVDYGDLKDGFFTQEATADVSSTSLTGLAQYQIDGNFSVHGGVRMQTVEAKVVKPPVLGYEIDADPSTAFGYVLGAAYERPEIALRVALTYNSAIEHDIDAVETCGAPLCSGESETTSVETPESFNLDFQSGVAEDTLVFGSIRYAKWTQFDYAPPGHVALGQGSLQSYDDDTVAYNIGVGRRFSDEWSGAVSFGYEAGTGDFAGVLAPTDGNKSIGLGGTYTGDGFKVTGGLRYIMLGDADLEHPAIPGAVGVEFTDNYAIGAGLKITRSF